MASAWAKIFPVLYNCDMEIGFICRTSVGGKLMSFLRKNDSIEFFATYRDEYKSKHPRITIDMVVFASPSQKQ
jgi:hypothetical protein